MLAVNWVRYLANVGHILDYKSIRLTTSMCHKRFKLLYHGPQVYHCAASHLTAVRRWWWGCWHWLFVRLPDVEPLAKTGNAEPCWSVGAQAWRTCQGSVFSRLFRGGEILHWWLWRGWYVSINTPTRAHTHTHTHTHTTVLRPSWILSRTIQVSRYHKGKTRKIKPIWIYCSHEWQCHQLGLCKSALRPDR